MTTAQKSLERIVETPHINIRHKAVRNSIQSLLHSYGEIVYYADIATDSDLENHTRRHIYVTKLPDDRYLSLILEDDYYQQELRDEPVIYIHSWLCQFKIEHIDESNNIYRKTYINKIQYESEYPPVSEL